jgi:membrane protease YdiL (CAAX protease family)
MRRKIAPILVVLVLLEILALQVTSLFASASPYAIYAYLMTSYAAIAATIWAEKDNLSSFHIDRLSLIALVFSMFFRRRLGIPGEGFFLFAIGLLGVACLVFLVKHGSRVEQTRLGWALAGCLVGGFVVIPVTITESLQLRAIPPLYSSDLILTVLRSVIYELSFAALVEEIVFRGLVWGYLRRAGLSDNKAAVAQGVLFWLAHLGQASTVLVFVLALPLLILASTILTQRARQVFPAVLSHTVINTMPVILLNFMFR